MSKRKVLIVTTSFCQGGIEHSLITALKAINPEKYDVTVFSCGEDMTLLPMVPGYVKVITDDNPPHYYMRPKAIYFQICQTILGKMNSGWKEKYREKLNDYLHILKMQHPAKDIFKKDKFDVVISYAVGRFMEIALNFEAERHYVFFHSSLDLHHELFEKLFPKFDNIVAVSQAVKNMLCENYPIVKEKVIVLQNYVDAEEIISKAHEEIIEIGEIEADIVLSTCGRLSKEKGFDMAVEAASILKKYGVSFKWFFVGDGDEREKLELKINEYGLNDYIRITGFKDNPFPYINACDIYVQTSYEEAQPLAILEAQILGKAIVSTATLGGNTILDGGKKGVLTSISAKGIAEGILLMVNNPEKKKSLENLYSIEENLAEREIYQEKWNELLSK